MRRRDFVAGALGALAGLAGCGTEPGRPAPRFSFVAGGATWEPLAETLAGLLDPADLAHDGTRLTVTGLPALAAAEMNRVGERGTPLARLIGDVEALVVPKKSRFRDFDAFAAHLVASPGQTALAGRKQGESDHLLFGLVARGLGADARVLDYAGYPTCADAADALLAGKAGVAAGPLGQWRERIGEGRLRVLAVSSAERVEGIDAPTLLESGARVDFADWSAVLGPNGMGEREKAGAVDLLDEVTGSERWLKACRVKGWTPIPLLGDDFGVWLGSETARTRTVLGELGLLDTTCGRGCVGGH
ncbi:tripartite tricarboxylate transporter substrate-binding protein [Nonomuraea dietziae]|uniref:tripartite tricarboxylate transporter substrate-binding protein n=1 Tax=Nonomuraea dietziae TaxID=65515 RepID=UPI0033CC0FBE